MHEATSSGGGRSIAAGASAARAGALWGAAGGLVCGALAPLEPNLLEEGLMVHVAERMLAGEHLYRDVVIVTGPAPFAFVAGLFALFGKHLLVARAGVVVLQALACAAVYGLSRRAGAGAWAHAAAACFAFGPVLFFPLPSTTFYTTVATSLAVVAGYAALRGVHSLAWAVAAGALIALTALSKQTVGAVLALAALPAVALCAAPGLRARQALAVVGGGLGVAVATLGVFAVLGDLRVFVESMLARPEGDIFGFPFINLWPPGELAAGRGDVELYVPEVVLMLRRGAWPMPAVLVAATQLLFALPVLAAVATLVARLPGSFRPGLWLFAATALALAANLFPRADAGHLVFVAPAVLAYAVTLLGVLATRRFRAPGPHRLGAGAVVAAVAAGGLLASIGLYRLSVPPDWGPRVPIRAISGAKRSPAVGRAIGFLRERLRPGEPIFVARNEALFYFATGAPNPTPYTGVLQVWGIRRDQQDRILAALDGVRFVVMSDIDHPIHTFYGDELPRVQAYLERHFNVPAEFTALSRLEDWVIVLERGRDRGATAVDLLDPRLPRRAWRLDAAGQVGPAPELPRFPARQNRRPLGVPVDAHGAGVDFAVEVPPDARFEASIGFHRIEDAYQPDGTAFTLLVGEDELREVGSWVARFDERNRGRAWTPVQADLSAFAGRRVTLRLAARAGLPVEGVAFWGSPRIVQRRAEAAASP